jgi:hypothetical protein
MTLFDRIFGNNEEEKQPIKHTPGRTEPQQRDKGEQRTIEVESAAREG